MTIDLFLFAKNKATLVDYLDQADLDPADFFPAALTTDVQSNNPWRLLDAHGAEIHVADRDGNRGFGVPVRRTDAEARDILKRLREAGSDPAQAVGVEVLPNTLALALRGQHWCSGTGRGRALGTRIAANRLINQSALRSAGLTGEGVNVVVVDQGVSQQYVESLGGIYGGGMTAVADDQTKLHGEGKSAYTSLPNRHGSMLVRSVIDAAPKAKIFDVPLLPKRINNVRDFSLYAAWAGFLFGWIHDVGQGTWVFLNAWGIVDRFAEPIRGEYTANLSHPLNALVRFAGQTSDIVFAAGNSGQFCAEPRVPGYDRLPGQAVFGANGLPEVTCVGAVRTDGQWVGASSQGRGPFEFGDVRDEKPDLAAPSWFTEPQDARLRSTGTSAASAIVAGAIAALRQGWSADVVSPAQMRDALRHSARDISGGTWSARTGDGVIDLAAAIQVLTERHGAPSFALARADIETQAKAAP